VIIVLFENLWERKFLEIVRKYGGELRRQDYVSPAELVERARELGVGSQSG
jgi:hypothetical protein